MGTNVKLYYTYSTISGSKWELIPSRLFIVEDIESYLATKTCKTITDFQYIKNEYVICLFIQPQNKEKRYKSNCNTYTDLPRKGRYRKKQSKGGTKKYHYDIPQRDPFEKFYSDFCPTRNKPHSFILDFLSVSYYTPMTISFRRRFSLRMAIVLMLNTY